MSLVLLISLVSFGYLQGSNDTKINAQTEKDFNNSTQNIISSLENPEKKYFTNNVKIIRQANQSGSNNYRYDRYHGLTIDEFNESVYRAKRMELEKELSDLNYEIRYEEHVFESLIDLRKPLKMIEVKPLRFNINDKMIKFSVINKADQTLKALKIKARLLNKKTGLPWVTQVFTSIINNQIQPFERKIHIANEELNHKWQHSLINNKEFKLELILLNATLKNDKLLVPELGKYSINYIKDMKSRTKYLKLKIGNVIKTYEESSSLHLFAF